MTSKKHSNDLKKYGSSLAVSSLLSRLIQIKKKLRIFISHQYPVRFDADTAGIDDEQVQYWEMRVEGRLLDDVSSIFTNEERSI